MYVFGSILLLVSIGALHLVRWRILVNREFRRQGFIRTRSNRMMLVDPAPGWRLIEACTCTRDGRLYDVIVLNQGWLRARLHLTAEPAD